MNWLEHLMRPALGLAGRRKLTILIYHRVHRDTDALFPAAMDARRFDEQLSWIKAALNVVPMPEAIEMLQGGRLPKRAACITFDDGYADNIDEALPVLLRHGLTATIFVASGYLDGGRMWNDTIIEAVRRAPGSGLDLEFLGLGSRPMDTPKARRTAIDEIIESVKYLDPGKRQEKVDALARAVGEALPDDLMLRSAQVRALHVAGMSIGAHTVTHPILARLDDESARSEIRDGRAALESILGTRVSLFAYPNGKPVTDYGPAHVSMVRELGFSAAVSTRPGVADAATDRFQLPRFTPWATSFLQFGVGLGRNQLESRSEEEHR
jgi:peptidoglycan/xylan/chitin deacetylase (PgdA/CDA1 family)